MKKVTIFKIAVIALFACVGFVACSTESIETPPTEPETQPETYTVKLGWAGEILDVSYEPMETRAATDDLYGIQVYSKPNTEDYRSWSNYAYGLFDDPSNITITLQSGFKYKFVATMVKSGKYRICKSTDGYWFPFSVVVGHDSVIGQHKYAAVHSDNKFYYDASKYIDFIGSGYTQLTDRNNYYRPNIERFYGELIDYIPEESSANAKIEMKRTSFGAKFVAGGKLAVDGKLEIQIDNAPKMELALTDGEDEISDIFTFKDVDAAWAKDDYTEDIEVSFKWIRTDGTEPPLGTHKITFKRNTITVVEVNIDKNNGIDLDIPDSETGDLAEGDTVTINDGELVETEVETEGETN